MLPTPIGRNDHGVDLADHVFVARRGQLEVLADLDLGRKQLVARKDLAAGLEPAQVGEPVELRWSPPGERNYVEVLSIDQDVVLLAREVGPPPFTVRLPWPGTFRWRVTTRTPDGFASLPSAEGLIPVMGK